MSHDRGWHPRRLRRRSASRGRWLWRLVRLLHVVFPPSRATIVGMPTNPTQPHRVALIAYENLIEEWPIGLR